ncbi:MAG: hypothetical protein M3296_05105 [Actinomycetota bacterium]|nr:hypothetical protein [Actinomycetota bacterium]
MIDDVPLLPAEIVGYRAWRLGDDGDLRAYVSGHPDDRAVWTRGDVTAHCRTGHEAPAIGCSCGLHAAYEPPDPCRDGGFGRNHGVYGAVVCWGNIDTTSTDFRAQYARIVCLAFWRMQTWHHTELIRATARRHGVPCVELAELPDVAREHGEEIPRALRGLAPAGGRP